MYDMECGMAVEPMQVNWTSSRVDLGYTILFPIPVVTSLSFYTCDSDLGVSMEFHQANQGSLRVCLGTLNCSACKAEESVLISRRGEVSWFFSCCSGNMRYILEL